MRTAIVGSGGYIAGFLLTRLEKDDAVQEVMKIDRSAEADVYLNLLDAEQFDYSVLENIDFVIFTAAISGPDKCAEEYDLCWKINVEGTRHFISEAIKRKCRVLFFSSDAVFGDIPGEVYTELSDTRATTPYGRMKKAIEDMFKDNPYFKAIRLSYVVSAKDRFVSYCFSCIEKEETAEIFHPFYRNCITVEDVVEVVEWFLKHWEIYPVSVLNVAGKELVSRIRIADELNRHLEKRLDYKIVRPEAGFFRNRPPVTQMKSLYMQQYQILEDITFTEKIKKELRKQ